MFKLAIIGMGHVGSHVLSDAASMNLFSEIAAIDINKDVAFGEALDHFHATGVDGARNTRIYSSDWAGLYDADIVIVTAGDSIKKEGEDRAGLVTITGNVTRSVMGQIVEHASKQPVVIFVTNPADTIAFIAQNEFDYPENKIIATGTMLDTARLKRHIANELDVSPQSVDVVVIGEHGLSAVPVLSGLRVGWSKVEGFDPDAVRKVVVDGAYEIISRRGWTDAGVSACALHLARTVLFDERAILPVSTTLHGEYGADGDVALSTPCTVGREGIIARHELELNDWERACMNESIDAVREAISRS